MTQEEKQLLLQDLCGRLPYGIKCNVGDNKSYTLNKIEIDDKNGHLLDFKEKKDGLDMQVYLSEVKPYLYPLSSMNLDQRVEYSRTLVIFDKSHCSQTHETYDWLNKNHFDFRGLIEKGLALDATGLNIY